MSQQKPYQKLAWLGTTLLLISAVLSAFNIYPYYVVGFICSSGLWTVIAILWKEKSLVCLNGGLTLIYILGILFI